MKNIQMMFVCLLFAQTTLLAQIKGRITDERGSALASATIELKRSPDSVLLMSVLSDSAGYFLLNFRQAGSYRLKMNIQGYEIYHTLVFTLNDSSLNIHLGTITLQSTPTSMAEVVVRAIKPLYQTTPGGMTVNVENSVMTKGSTVLAVLQRSPGVQLDARTNSLSLNGKTGVEVMIDGRLMNIPSDQLTQLLESMRGDDVEKIELLTTPPPGYEAEGNAGIINIVRKQNKRKGSNGNISVTGGYGQGPKTVISTGIGFNQDRLNISGNAIFSYDRSADNLYGKSYQNFPPLGGLTNVSFHNDNSRVQYTENIGFRGDYRFDKKTMLGASLSLISEQSKNQVINKRTIALLPDSMSFFDANIHGQARVSNWIGSVYLEKRYSGNATLLFDLDFISFRSSQPTQATSSFLNKEGMDAGGNDTLFSPNQQGYANTQIDIGVFKIDYQKRFSDKFHLESGVKGSLTRNSSVSGIESMVNGEWISRPETRTDISLSETIVAGYGSADLLLGRDIHMVGGLRYEFSRTGKSDLGVFFPYFSIRKTHWQLSYSKRIGRPSYRDLSSFITYNDPLSVFTGNPFLKPTITHNLNLVYDNKGYSVSMMLSRDINPITRWQIVESPNRDLMFIGPQNLLWQNNLTMQVNLPIRLAPWWTANINLIGGWKQYREVYTKFPLQKTWFGYSGTMSQTFILPKNYSIEISGWYNGDTYNGTTQTKSVGALNGGIKKQMNKNAGTLLFTVTDIFSTVRYITDYGRLTEEAFEGGSHVNFNPESRMSPVFRISWTKSFGSGVQKTSNKSSGTLEEEQGRIK